MSCNITGGFSLSCKDGVGGIDKIFIANGPVDSFTESAGVVTAITLPTGGSWFTFEVPKQSSSFSETISVSVENGTSFFTQQVELVFNRLEATKRNIIKALAQNTKLIIVVKLNDGKYISVGLEKGAELTAGTSESGKSFGDRQGGTLTFQALEVNPAYEVAAGIVE
jgi:hypothetical protein